MLKNDIESLNYNNLLKSEERKKYIENYNKFHEFKIIERQNENKEAKLMLKEDQSMKFDNILNYLSTLN